MLIAAMAMLAACGCHGSHQEHAPAVATVGGFADGRAAVGVVVEHDGDLITVEQDKAGYSIMKETLESRERAELYRCEGMSPRELAVKGDTLHVLVAHSFIYDSDAQPKRDYFTVNLADGTASGFAEGPSREFLDIYEWYYLIWLGDGYGYACTNDIDGALRWDVFKIVGGEYAEILSGIGPFRARGDTLYYVSYEDERVHAYDLEIGTDRAITPTGGKSEDVMAIAADEMLLIEEYGGEYLLRRLDGTGEIAVGKGDVWGYSCLCAAFDDKYFYFYDKTGVFRLSLGDGAKERLLEQTGVRSISLAGGRLYYEVETEVDAVGVPGKVIELRHVALDGAKT
ncbi:MAG: hypothetical protein LBG71_04770 [Clostridiales Family XIII bacterium]|nr:hypothetical protein [Clostridiales Family XIII bacterium]